MQTSSRDMVMNWLSLTPLFLAALLALTCLGVTSPDSGLYLTLAGKFNQGRIDWGFRPGFVALLAGCFKILGPSVWSATLVVRIFFVANVGLLFAMSRYLFDRQTAFAVSLTLLASHFLNNLSARVLLDNIHPFFVLAAAFLSILAVDRGSNRPALVAGLAFVYAYLIKSTTLLFVPLPLVLVWLRDGFRLHSPRMRQAGIIFAVTCLGLILYHAGLEIFHAGSKGVVKFFDEFERPLGEEILIFNVRSFYNYLFSGSFGAVAVNVAQGFFNFWKAFMFRDPWMGRFFCAGWIWIFLRSFTSTASRYVLSVGILFLPAMVYLGMGSLRLGQSGVFLFVTFIPLGVLIRDLAKGLVLATVPEPRNHARLVHWGQGLLAVSLALSLAIYQVWFAKNGSLRWMQQTCMGHILAGEPCTWKIRGLFDETSRKGAAILKEHADPGSRVLTDFTLRWAVDFFSGYQYDVTFFESEKIFHFDALQSNVAESLPQGSLNGELVFLWPNAWIRNLKNWNIYGELRLRYIDEGYLLDRLQHDDPVYVLLDRRYRHIGTYLDGLDGVRRLASDPLVYEVTEFRLREHFTPRVAYEMGMLLSQLRELNPSNYRVLRDRFFAPFFGFSPREVDALANLDEEQAGVMFMGYPGRTYHPDRP